MTTIQEMQTTPIMASEAVLRRRVIGLAWPVIAENGLETLLGIVDTVLVAHLAQSAIALAGVGSAVQAMQFLLAALAALSIGASILVAQAVGARDFARANTLARQSLLWSLTLSVPLAVVGFSLSGPVISLFGLEPAAASVGASYMRVTMGTAVVLVGLFIGNGVLRGAGDSRTPMFITTIANVINIPLAYCLIYGQFGFPNLGAVGSAWATFLARAIALGILLVVLWRGRGGITIRGGGGWRPNTEVARGVLGIGIPAALEQVLVTAGFFASTIVVGHLGTTLFAANRIAGIALSISFLPGIGFAIAATALMGQSVGARRLAEGVAAVRIATVGAVIWMGSMALLTFIFAPQLMRLFTQDPAVVNAGVDSLHVVAFAMPLLAVTFVQAGGLRGCGDTRTPLWIFGGGIWLSVILGSVGVFTIGGGLVTVWLGFVLAGPLMAWLMGWRFRTKMQDVQSVIPVDLPVGEFGA